MADKDKKKSESDELFDSAPPAKQTESEKLYSQAEKETVYEPRNGSSSGNGKHASPVGSAIPSAEQTPEALKAAKEALQKTARDKLPDAIKGIGAKLSADEFKSLGYFGRFTARTHANFGGQGKTMMKFARGGSALLGGAGVLDGTWRAFKGVTGAEKVGPDGQIKKGDWGDVFLGGAEALGGAAFTVFSLSKGGQAKIVSPTP